MESQDDALRAAGEHIARLALRYEQKRALKEELEEQAKDARADFESAEIEFYMALEAMGMDTYDAGDYRYTRDTKPYYRPAIDGEKFYRVLRENGLGDIIKETVNANTLNATFREIADMHDGELPDWLSPIVSVYDKARMSRRKK